MGFAVVGESLLPSLCSTLGKSVFLTCHYRPHPQSGLQQESVKSESPQDEGSAGLASLQSQARGAGLGAGQAGPAVHGSPKDK